MLRQVPILLCALAALAEVPAQKPVAPREAARGRIFYVRQTFGADENDGLSPATAWRSISRLGQTLKAGDTAFVGPGLYREMVIVGNPGTAEARIRLVADNSGSATGDPPGPVMVTGADAIDETAFREHGTGVYRAALPGGQVFGVVEMERAQRRYVNATEVLEQRASAKAPLEIVAESPSSFHYDEATGVLFIHTSDGAQPANHEIEVIRRAHGIVMYGKPYVTIVGFFLRHMGNSAIAFLNGSHWGTAIGNTSWGGWQGIRIHESEEVLTLRNTLFGNDNSGVYFAKESRRGQAINNIAYENTKGLRWSSASDDGLAVGNLVFDNGQGGIALEHVQGIRLAGNSLAGNGAQLYLRESRLESEGNCFEASTQGILALVPAPFKPAELRDLIAWRAFSMGDLTSTEGRCERVAKKNVGALHAEASAYLGQALSAASAPRRPS